MKSDIEKTRQELLAELETARGKIKKLEENSGLFHEHVENILDVMPDLISLHDLDFNIVYSNWKGLGSIPKDKQILGGKCYNVYRGFLQPCPDCIANQVIESKKTIHKEFKAAEGFWVELTAIPLLDKNGEVKYFLDRVRNINDIVNSKESTQKTQKELITQNKLLKGILDGIPDVVSVADPDRNVIRYNQAGYNLLGITEDKFKPRNCYELIGKTKPCSPCASALAISTKKLACMEKYVPELDMYLDCRNNPVFDDNGNIQSVVQILRDITDQKKFEEKLKLSEERLRSVFDDVDMVAIQGYDHERKVIYWNKSSKNLYGYTREEALGKKLEDLIIPDHMRQDVVQAVADWVVKDTPIPAGEITLKHKDGSPVYVYSSHVMQKGISGTKEMYCIDVNLAEVKKAHLELVRAKEMAEAANTSKSEFLANMSHEIRTPMNGILGMFQLMETTDMDDEQREYVQMGLQSSRRLTALLSDILDLSKVEAGKLSINNAPFDLNEILGQIQDLYQPTMNKTGVCLEVKIDDRLKTQVMGDGLRVQQVIINLLGNAFKFTHAGVVSLEASMLTSSKNRLRVLFCVADTGIGIPDDKVDDIFSHFTQLGQGFTRNYQGAGLGLSICKQLVSMMGGHISIESEMGQGTRIYVNLNFELAKPATPPISVRESRDLDDLATKVLLVEDDYVSLITAKKQMERVGCKVSAVTDGQKALDALQQSRFDLVLMDVQMPVMDGVEATKAIRQGKAGAQNKRIPIVAMTAYAMVGDKDKFLNAGMTGYLSKPIDFKKLMVILSKTRAGEL